MKNKKRIKWVKDTHSISGQGLVTEYRGVRIEKYSKGMLYVHWTENVHYAAPHSRMSQPIKSLQSARQYVDYLLEREQSEPHLVVHRMDQKEYLKIRDLKVLNHEYESYCEALKDGEFTHAKHCAEKYNEILERLGGPESNPGEFYLILDENRGLKGPSLERRDRVARLAEKYSNQGHYLGRLKRLARITGCRKALKHVKSLIELHQDCGSRPQGSDGVQYEISCMILRHCENELRFNQAQLNKLWYGVHYDSRETFGLEFPYEKGTDRMRSNC